MNAGFAKRGGGNKIVVFIGGGNGCGGNAFGAAQVVSVKSAVADRIRNRIRTLWPKAARRARVKTDEACKNPD